MDTSQPIDVDIELYFDQNVKSFQKSPWMH